MSYASHKYIHCTLIELHKHSMFDKFVENVHKIVLVHSILFVFANDTGKYVWDRYCKFQISMLTLKKVTHVLLTLTNIAGL